MRLALAADTDPRKHSFFGRPVPPPFKPGTGEGIPCGPASFAPKGACRMPLGRTARLQCAPFFTAGVGLLDGAVGLPGVGLLTGALSLMVGALGVSHSISSSAIASLRSIR